MEGKHKRPRLHGGKKHEAELDGMQTTFAQRWAVGEIPSTTFPEEGLAPNVVKQIIQDERMLDSNPRLNLASFVTTWMEPEAEQLMQESLNVNFVDLEEYPSSSEIHNRCVNMLVDLYHGEMVNGSGTGTATVGSSEAIMLAGLAMKRKWQHRRQAEKKPTDKPNIVMGSEIQVCWEKFCRYFEVEERFIDMEVGGPYVMDPAKAVELVDENTIGVCVILGSTYTGDFEDAKEVNRLLLQKNEATGWNVPIHVDAASGGFVAPFVYPDLEWDFRLPLVRSINVSGHKYGLVYPGVGWCIFKSKGDLPDELVFHTNYLGSDQPSFTLNFSRGASQIIGQYYQFLRMGRCGYTALMKNLKQVASSLKEAIESTGFFTVHTMEPCLPLVAFSLLPLQDGTKRVYDEFIVSDKLKERGWVVPAYTMAPNAKQVKLLRVVVREDLSWGTALHLVEDLKRAVEWLDSMVSTLSHEQFAKFREPYVKKYEKHRHHSNPRRKRHSGVC